MIKVRGQGEQGFKSNRAEIDRGSPLTGVLFDVLGSQPYILYASRQEDDHGYLYISTRGKSDYFQSAAMLADSSEIFHTEPPFACKCLLPEYKWILITS